MDSSWISNSFFEEILKNDFPNESIQVKNYLIRPALGNGENYTSEMMRAIVHFYVNNDQLCEQKFIIKAPLSNVMLKKSVEEMGLFTREIIVYGKILPEVKKLLLQIGDDTKLSPKCYAANLENSYLVFEDLSVQEYQNSNRKIGVDMEHAKQVLSKVAKLHAATAVLKTMNFSALEELSTPSITKDNIPWKLIIENGMETVGEYLKNEPDFEHLHSKFEKTRKIIFEKMCEAMIPNKDGINALLHGDLWCNNMMFKYKNERPCDVIMVDYQLSFWGPIVIDLSYHLFTSSHEDLRDEHWDQLLQHYHETLRETLLKLNFSNKIPTLRDIHTELLQRGIGSVGMGLIILASRKLEKLDKDPLGYYMENSPECQRYRMDVLSNPKNKKGFKFLLNYFDRKGFFDY